MGAMLVMVSVFVQKTVASDDIRELWTGRIYTSTYRVGICFQPEGELRGVLLLRLTTGKEDVYHIFGRMDAGVLTARHTSGHSFRGHFDDDEHVSGEITLKSGRIVRLAGQRHHHAPLSVDTCRPLEEEAK